MTYDDIKSTATWPIVSWKVMGGFILLVALVIGGESGIGLQNKNASVTATQATCTVQSFKAGGEVVDMYLKCSAPGYAVVSDRELIANYLNKPGRLTCKLYRGNDADCKLAN